MTRKSDQAVIEANHDLDKLADETQKVLDELQKIEKEQNKRIAKLEGQLGNLQYFSETSPEQLREELIVGIRKLGEKVNGAIKKINERFDNFATEVYKRIDENAPPDKSDAPEDEEKKFGELKENALLDADDFEVVPKEAIKNLTELLKKQTRAIHGLKERHEFLIRDLENRVKSLDKDKSELEEFIEKKSNKIFRLVMIAFVLIVIVFILTQIF